MGVAGKHHQYVQTVQDIIPPPALVQWTGGGIDNSSLELVLNLPSQPQEGNRLIMALSAKNRTQDVLSIEQTGVVWTRVTEITIGQNDQYPAMWYSSKVGEVCGQTITINFESTVEQSAVVGEFRFLTGDDSDLYGQFVEVADAGTTVTLDMPTFTPDRAYSCLIGTMAKKEAISDWTSEGYTVVSGVIDPNSKQATCLFYRVADAGVTGYTGSISESTTGKAQAAAVVEFYSKFQQTYFPPGGGTGGSSPGTGIIQSAVAIQDETAQCTVTLPNAPTAGNTLFLYIATNDSSAPTRITDIAMTGVTWTQIGSEIFSTDNASGSWWYGHYTSTTDTSVVVSFNLADSYVGILIEVAGAATSGDPTQGNNSSFSNTSVTNLGTGNFAISAGDGEVLALAGFTQGYGAAVFSGPSDSFTILEQDGSGGGSAEDAACVLYRVFNSENFTNAISVNSNQVAGFASLSIEIPISAGGGGGGPVYSPPEPFVQKATLLDNGASGSTTINLPTTPQPGNELFLYIGTDNDTTSSLVSSVSMTGVTWTKLAELGNGSDNAFGEWWRGRYTGELTTSGITIGLSSTEDVLAFAYEINGQTQEVNVVSGVGATPPASTSNFSINTTDGTRLLLVGETFGYGDDEPTGVPDDFILEDTIVNDGYLTFYCSAATAWALKENENFSSNCTFSGFSQATPGWVALGLDLERVVTASGVYVGAEAGQWFQLIQSTTAGGYGSAGAKTFTLDSAPTTGNILLLWLACGNNTAISSVASTGVTWTRRVGPVSGWNSDGTGEWWTGEYSSSGDTSIDVTVAGANPYAYAGVLFEVSGAQATGNPVYASNQYSEGSNSTGTRYTGNFGIAATDGKMLALGGFAVVADYPATDFTTPGPGNFEFVGDGHIDTGAGSLLADNCAACVTWNEYSNTNFTGQAQVEYGSLTGSANIGIELRKSPLHRITQVATIGGNFGSPSFDITLNAPPSVNNDLWLFIAHGEQSGDGSSPVTGVSSTGVTWTQVVASQEAGGSQCNGEWWRGTYTSSSDTTITVAMDHNEDVACVLIELETLTIIDSTMNAESATSDTSDKVGPNFSIASGDGVRLGIVGFAVGHGGTTLSSPTNSFIEIGQVNYPAAGGTGVAAGVYYRSFDNENFTSNCTVSVDQTCEYVAQAIELSY